MNTAQLGGAFLHHAHAYAIHIVNSCPAKNVWDQDGNPTTPYQYSYGRKPSLDYFCVFGCPVYFKHYEPTFCNKLIAYKQQLQCILWYLYWIPKKITQLAGLLSWTTPAHCNHLQCLLWQRLQLSPCLPLKTLYQSRPHLISHRPKWTPNFWQFWTLNCPPNWICSQSWPPTIYLHWRTQRLWATHPRTGQCNFTHWIPTRSW